MAATTNTDREGLDAARDVLVFAREGQAAASRAQADLMLAAVTWAEHTHRSRSTRQRRGSLRVATPASPGR